MTTPEETQALLPVTQADRDLAERLCFGMSEKAVSEAAILISRHRISHSLPGDDIVEEGYRGGYDFFRNKWIGDQEEMITDMVRCFVPRPLPRDVEDHAAIADKIIAAVKADDDCRGRGKFEVMQILAALTPSALSGDAGEEGDEFNRGVLIAVSTLINCWGNSTEAEHLLAMINADAAMIERMGFTDYDREPLLAALPSHQGAGEP